MRENLDKLLSFYRSKSESICFLDGESCSFKTDIFNYSLNYLNEDVLVFRFNCFEGSSLDDIFLSFFEDMKKYSQSKKVTFTKLDTMSFSQKINAYLNYIQLPCLIVFDSFDNILAKANPVEKEEVIAYIKHLNSLSKFKILLIGNSFNSFVSDIKSHNNTIVFKPFDFNQVKQYFLGNKQNFSDEDIVRFHKITNGNVLQLLLTVNIITTLKVSLSDLLSEFDVKKITYLDFLIQKLMTFVPDTSKKKLCNIALFNLGINTKYLVDNNLFSKDEIVYMLEKGLLKEEVGFVFVKNYLKKFLLNNLTNTEKSKIHQVWKDFYSSQLPLPPNNRTILISRNTMRSQIDYHNSNIITKVQKEKEYADLSLMSYLNSNLTDWNIKNTNKKDSSKTESTVEKSVSTTNKDTLTKYELTPNELSLLSTPVDIRKKQESLAKENLYSAMEKREESFLKAKNKTLKDIFENAITAEVEYDLDTAYTLYCSLLSLKDDSDFYEYEPLILDKLAQCSKKQNRTIDAIDFYNKLTDLYLIRKDVDNYNEIKIKIALIYKEIYKVNHARVIFEHFINKKSPASDKILLKSCVELAEIEESLSNTDKAVELYKKAFSLYNEGLSIERDYIANAYYKYAVILDSFNQTQAAMDYYQKCIRTAENETTFVAAAYANFAEIVYDSGNIVKAVESFNKALFIDERLKNDEGVYYITLKLSQIAEISAPELVEDLLKKSHAAAKRFNDSISVGNSYIELGDYYYKNSDLKQALQCFLKANIAFKNNVELNIDENPLLARINDIKKHLPENVYNNIVSSVEDEVGINE